MRPWWRPVGILAEDVIIVSPSHYRVGTIDVVRESRERYRIETGRGSRWVKSRDEALAIARHVTKTTKETSR